MFLAVEILVYVLAGLRCLGVKTALFQAVAHVVVGGLFGAGFKGDRRSLSLAVFLTVLEVVCFVAGRLLPPVDVSFTFIMG